MATQVDQLPGPGGRRSRRSYPWDKWLDGTAWHLRRGAEGDYQVLTTAMRAYLYNEARRRGMAVETVRDVDGEGLTIQAVVPTTIGTAPAAGNPVMVA